MNTLRAVTWTILAQVLHPSGALGQILTLWGSAFPMTYSPLVAGRYIAQKNEKTMYLTNTIHLVPHQEM